MEEDLFSGVAEAGKPSDYTARLPKHVQQDTDYLHAVEKFAEDYHVDPRTVHAIVHGESGFNPGRGSRTGSYSGLFQIGKSDLQAMGLTNDDLEKMTRAQQVDVYRKYLRLVDYRPGDGDDALILTQPFGARHIRQAPRDHIVWGPGTPAWNQNKGWRSNSPGNPITVGSALDYYKRSYRHLFHDGGPATEDDLFAGVSDAGIDPNSDNLFAGLDKNITLPPAPDRQPRIVAQGMPPGRNLPPAPDRQPSMQPKGKSWVSRFTEAYQPNILPTADVMMRRVLNPPEEDLKRWQAEKIAASKEIADQAWLHPGEAEEAAAEKDFNRRGREGFDIDRTLQVYGWPAVDLPTSLLTLPGRAIKGALSPIFEGAHSLTDLIGQGVSGYLGGNSEDPDIRDAVRETFKPGWFSEDPEKAGARESQDTWITLATLVPTLFGGGALAELAASGRGLAGLAKFFSGAGTVAEAGLGAQFVNNYLTDPADAMSGLYHSVDFWNAKDFNEFSQKAIGALALAAGAVKGKAKASDQAVYGELMAKYGSKGLTPEQANLAMQFAKAKVENNGPRIKAVNKLWSLFNTAFGNKNVREELWLTGRGKPVEDAPGYVFGTTLNNGQYDPLKVPDPGLPVEHKLASGPDIGHTLHQFFKGDHPYDPKDLTDAISRGIIGGTPTIDRLFPGISEDVHQTYSWDPLSRMLVADLANYAVQLTKKGGKIPGFDNLPSADRAKFIEDFLSNLTEARLRGIRDAYEAAHRDVDHMSPDELALEFQPHRSDMDTGTSKRIGDWLSGGLGQRVEKGVAHLKEFFHSHSDAAMKKVESVDELIDYLPLADEAELKALAEKYSDKLGSFAKQSIKNHLSKWTKRSPGKVREILGNYLESQKGKAQTIADKALSHLQNLPTDYEGLHALVGEYAADMPARTLAKLRDLMGKNPNKYIEQARKALKDHLADKAANVTSIKDEYSFMLTHMDPRFKPMLERYKATVEKVLQKSHESYGGTRSTRLGPYDTYIPLRGYTSPVEGEGIRTESFAPDPRSALVAGVNVNNKFASGTSPHYDSSPYGLAESIRESGHRNSRGRVIRGAEEAGLILPMSDAQYMAAIEHGASGLGFNMEFNGKLEPARWIKADAQGNGYAVPTRLWAELEPTLRIGEEKGPGALSQFLTKAQMAGFTDATSHSRSVLSGLSQWNAGGRNWLESVLKGVPIARKLSAYTDLIGRHPFDKGPETTQIDKVIELARVGALPTRLATESISPALTEYGGIHSPAELAKFESQKFDSERFRDLRKDPKTPPAKIVSEFFKIITGPAQKGQRNLGAAIYGPSGTDIRARLALLDTIEKYNKDATTIEKRDFVNHVGAYSRVLHADWEAFLKRTGINPFATAYKTFTAEGVRAMNPFSTGLGKKAPLKSQAQFVLANSLSGSRTPQLAAGWAIAYHAATGKWPWQDEGSKLGFIPLTPEQEKAVAGLGILPKEKLNGKTQGPAEFDVFSLIGTPLIKRGLRAIGAVDAYNTFTTTGGDQGLTEEAMGKGIRNMLIGSVTSGPLPGTLGAGLLGAEPQIASTRNYSGKPSLKGPGSQTGKYEMSFYPATPSAVDPADHGGLKANLNAMFRHLNSALIGTSPMDIPGSDLEERVEESRPPAASAGGLYRLLSGSDLLKRNNRGARVEVGKSIAYGAKLQKLKAEYIERYKKLHPDK